MRQNDLSTAAPLGIGRSAQLERTGAGKKMRSVSENRGCDQNLDSEGGEFRRERKRMAQKRSRRKSIEYDRATRRDRLVNYRPLILRRWVIGLGPLDWSRSDRLRVYLHV
jgi:hypothetical protein